MTGHLSCFRSFMTLVFLLPAISAFPLPPDDYLEEAPDFENMLSDLPPGFDFSTASEAELRSIPFLNPQDIESILSLRDSIPGNERARDEYTLTERMSPLLRFLLDTTNESNDSKTRKRAVSLRGGFLVHRGESMNTGRQYLKIVSGPGERYRFSVLGEHDPFEPRALDLASAGISIPVDRLKSEAVLGDFRPGFGMGLLFARYSEYLIGSRPRYYSSSTVLNTSFEESRSLRGGIVITQIGPFGTNFWTSIRRLDATLENGKTVTVNDTGLHPSGAPRGNLEERMTGAHVSLGGNRNELSLTGAVSRYSPAFSRPDGEKYFGRPDSGTFPQFSVAGRTQRGRAEFTFEHARMNGGEHATLGGIVIDGGRAETSLLLRDYSPGFWAFRSGAPSAFGSVSNERGVYSSLDVTLPARLYLTASLDLARMRGRSWTRPMPLSRSQLFISIRKNLRTRLNGSVAYRSSRDSGPDGGRWSLRGRMESAPERGREWGWRGTAALSAGKGKGGPFAEAALSRKRSGRVISCSAGVFSIPSYFSRYYIYLPDVPGRGLTTGVWGKGYSFALVCTIGSLSGRIRVSDSNLMTMQREFTLQTDMSF